MDMRGQVDCPRDCPIAYGFHYGCADAIDATHDDRQITGDSKRPVETNWGVDLDLATLHNVRDRIVMRNGAEDLDREFPFDEQEVTGLECPNMRGSILEHEPMTIGTAALK
jgi:hypothetical protein